MFFSSSTQFNPVSPLSEGDGCYNSSPALNDKVHCLVSVVPADKIPMWSATEGVIVKMKEVRKAASDLGKSLQKKLQSENGTGGR